MEDAQTSYLEEMNFYLWSLDFSQADKVYPAQWDFWGNFSKVYSNGSGPVFGLFSSETTSIISTLLPGKPKLYNLLRRKSKLKIRLFAAKCARNSTRIKELEDEIGLVSYEIKEAIIHHLKTRVLTER